jgi:hypothetical protein
LTRSADAGCPNGFARPQAWQQPDATGAGVNRFHVIDRIKHSGVMALRLDSVTRAG